MYKPGLAMFDDSDFDYPETEAPTSKVLAIDLDTQPNYIVTYTEKNGAVGEKIRSDEPTFIINKDEMPIGLGFRIGSKGPFGKADIDSSNGVVTYTPDASESGKKVSVPVEVVFKDGTTILTQFPVQVAQTKSDKYYGQIITKLIKLPFGYEVTQDLVTKAVQWTSKDNSQGKLMVIPDDEQQLNKIKDPGNYELPVTVTYDDGSKTKLTLRVQIGEPIKQVEEFGADVKPQFFTKRVGETVTLEDLKQAIKLDPTSHYKGNLEIELEHEMPKGDKAGEQEFFVWVIFDDGTKRIVPMKMKFEEPSIKEGMKPSVEADIPPVIKEQPPVQQEVPEEFPPMVEEAPSEEPEITPPTQEDAPSEQPETVPSVDDVKPSVEPETVPSTPEVVPPVAEEMTPPVVENKPEIETPEVTPPTQEDVPSEQPEATPPMVEETTEEVAPLIPEEMPPVIEEAPSEEPEVIPPTQEDVPSETPETTPSVEDSKPSVESETVPSTPEVIPPVVEEMTPPVVENTPEVEAPEVDKPSVELEEAPQLQSTDAERFAGELVTRVIKKPFGEAPSEGLIREAVSFIKDHTYTGDRKVNIKGQLPDGQTPGHFNVPVEVVFDDGSAVNTDVRVKVGSGGSQADRFGGDVVSRLIRRSSGEAVTLEDVTRTISILDSSEYKEGVSVIIPSYYMPTDSNTGHYEIPVLVQFADGSVVQTTVRVLVR